MTHAHTQITKDSRISVVSDKFYVNGYDDFARHDSGYSAYNIICDQLPTVEKYFLVTNNGLGITGYVNTAWSLPGQNWIYFGTGDSSITTVDAMKSWLADNPLQVVYELAQPTTYTLTASQVKTLLGDNTLWMDADGSIDLTYRADTQKYIDSRIALLNSNLAFIEDGMTASRAYSVGQYVLISGQLYKVTASIASGATFTVGTNVVATTVGTELTALN